jgi:hypothetical protein
MPTATPFSFFGRGNGFDICIGETPLNFRSSTGSNTEMFTTLAGVNSNNPVATQDQIDESLRLAYNLVYNTYQFLGSSFSNRTGSGDSWNGTINDIVLKKSSDDYGNNAINPSQPIDRCCEVNASSNIYNGDFDLNIRSRASASLPSSIGFLTHNGQKNGNLIGYSVFSPFFSPICFFSGNRSASATTSVSLTTTSANYQGNQDPTGELKNAFVELNGMHFICTAQADPGRSGDVINSRTLDPSNLLAQCDLSFTSSSGTANLSSRCEITGIEFYTYN